MRIVNSFEASCKDDLNLRFPADCVLNGILSVCPIIYFYFQDVNKSFVRVGRMTYQYISLSPVRYYPLIC